MLAVRALTVGRNVGKQDEKEQVSKKRQGVCIIMRKGEQAREKGEKAKSLSEMGRLEGSFARLITSGSKFPVNHLYNTQAIRLKE